MNGVEITVNQSDRARIDLGHALQSGENTLTVRVATTMFNAVRATGDSNYQLMDWQHTGLLGPVVRVALPRHRPPEEGRRVALQ